jgi:hypothetical protein
LSIFFCEKDVFFLLLFFYINELKIFVEQKKVLVYCNF